MKGLCFLLSLVLLLSSHQCLCSELEETSSASNLLVNPSFEMVNGTDVTGWRSFVNGYFLCSQQAHTGTHAASMTPRHTYGAYQHIDVDADHPWQNGLSVSAHAYTEWSYGSENILAVDLLYRDGSRSGHQLMFAAGIHDWHQRCFHVELAGPLETLTVYLVSLPGMHYGTTWYDDISVTFDSSCSDAAALQPGFINLDERLLVSVEQEDVFSPNVDVKDKPPMPKFQKITLVTYAYTDDQLKAAIDLCALQWQGPCIIVWYMATPDDYRPGRGLEFWIEMQKEHHSAVAPVLMVAFGPMPELPLSMVPLNAIRNLGESRVRTDYVFHLDPFAQLPGDSHQVFLREVERVAPDASRVLVIPSFELTGADVPDPNEKEELLSMVNDGLVGARHSQRHPLSQSCTDYARWMRTTEPYDIVPMIPADALQSDEQKIHAPDHNMEARHRRSDNPEQMFNRHYSPILLTHKNMGLLYDQRFLNGGHDKASYLAELLMRNVTFTVLPNAFAYYKHGTKPEWEVHVSAEIGLRMWFDYINFLEEARHKYTEIDIRVFNVLAIDPTVPHRINTPFSSRLALVVGCIAAMLLLLRALLAVPAQNGSLTFHVLPQSLHLFGGVGSNNKLGGKHL